MTTAIFIIFCTVYLGMILGGLPFLQLDRTGIALLGAIALIGVEAVSPEEAAKSIHLPTLILLFSFMVVSAQMRLGGFYTWITRRLAALPLSPPTLLATLIGNPQNMLIGETLELSFGGYISQALVPVLLGLAVTWGLIAWQTRGRWMQAVSVAADHAASERREEAPFDRWQTAKGLSVSAALLAVFLFVPSWPRDVAALTGAGLLLMSRRLHSNKMLGLVDWELLILFIGLFVVNHALQETGIAAGIVADLAAAGANLERPGPLFAATLVLSNVVSNVPAVMLLLPVAEHALAGPTLALVSTLSGNLLIVGSIANIIVVNAPRAAAS